MSLAAFKFVETSAVVAGDLNPAILVPDWIAQHTLLGSPTNLRFHAVGAPPQFEYERDGETITLQCRPDRLIIATNFEHDIAAVAAASIFGELRHTPVRAIGINFKFRIVEDSVRESIALALDCRVRRMLQEYAEASDGRLLEDHWYMLDVGRCILKVRLGSDLSTIDLNAHRDVSDADNAKESLGRWADDRSQAQAVLRSLTTLEQ